MIHVIALSRRLAISPTAFWGAPEPIRGGKGSNRLKSCAGAVTRSSTRFNRGIWRALEESARAWAKSASKVHVITGVLFHDPDEEDERRADGLVEVTVIGEGGVSVPTHFFKILVLGESPAVVRALAFVLENRPYEAPYRLEDCIRSIDWIEERSGFDFMPELSPWDEERVERAPSVMWGRVVEAPR